MASTPRESTEDVSVTRPGDGMSGFAWTSFGRLTLQAANLVALTVTSRFIAPADFGLFAPVAILVTLISAVTEGTFATPLMQRNDLRDDHIRVSVWASVFASIAMTAVLMAGSPLVERAFGFAGLATVVAIAASMLPARLIAAVPTALLQRQMRFRELALVALFTAIVGKTLPTIALAVAGYGVWALVTGFIVQAYLDSAILWMLARPKAGWPRDWGCARDVLGFGSRFMAIQTVNQLAMNVDNILVGRLLGPAALGFYNRAFALMMLPVTLLGSSAQQVLFPRFSRLQQDRDTLRSELYMAVDLVNGLIMPLVALLVIVTDSLVLLVLGSAWASVVLPTRILFATVTFRIGYKVAETLSFATASLMPALVRQVGYAAAIALGTFVGSRWGLVGVACGVGTALVLFYVSSLSAAARLVDASWQRLALLHGRGLLITVLAAGPAAVVGALGNQSLTSRIVADGGAVLLFCFTMAAIMFRGPAWLSGASAPVVGSLANRLTRVIRFAPPQPAEPAET